ncbi:MAG: glutamyl-tRNA reductase [Candidatus Bathyarchaeum sp.]|nr:MAG: glutamyl-tRNA reductase [Candidatus Bathyarchaeum sp.]
MLQGYRLLFSAKVCELLYLSWRDYPSMQSSADDINIINVRITHQKSHVALIENVAFKDIKSSLIELCSIISVDECVILQTCNRTELFIVSTDTEDTAKKINNYIIKKCGTESEEAAKAIETSTNQDALKHLLRVASGLESMVIGEDQILGQVWGAYSTAASVNTVGPILKTVFTRAVSVGRRVRNQTEINRGSVSIGSVAVELAETLLEGLEGKNVLVMGAGETGTIVAKALSRCCPNAIFIANRTYERAVKLANELEGKAVKFDKLEEVLKDADVVICSTSAPHYLLRKESVCNIMKQRNKKTNLMIIDISNPRNVEESVQDANGVKLYNIDDLRVIADKNKEKRKEKAKKASKIIDEALLLLEQDLKAQSVSNIVSCLFSHAEEIRQKEQIKAFNMLGKLDEKKKDVIDGLTFEIVEQTLVPIVEKLRKAAINDDKQLIDVAIKLFGVNKN